MLQRSKRPRLAKGIFGDKHSPQNANSFMLNPSSVFYEQRWEGVIYRALGFTWFMDARRCARFCHARHHRL